MPPVHPRPKKKREKREELEEGSLRCDLSQRDRGGRTIIGSKEREITDVEVFAETSRTKSNQQIRRLRLCFVPQLVSL